MKYFLYAIVAFVLVLSGQAVYTIANKTYCTPHYDGKRIYFWSESELDFAWEMDILGLASRTTDELIRNHEELVTNAFNSAGNMHNPEVEKLRAVFVKILRTKTHPFLNSANIEKFHVREAECD